MRLFYTVCFLSDLYYFTVLRQAATASEILFLVTADYFFVSYTGYSCY